MLFFSLLDFLSERNVLLRWEARLGDVRDDGAAGVVGMGDWRGA